MGTTSGEMESSSGFVLSGLVSSEFEYFYAISVFTTRPHILNRCIKGAQLDLDENCEFCPKFFSGQNILCEVPHDVLQDLKEPFLKSTIDELRDLGVERFTLVRSLIGHSLREYASTETWDLNNQFVVIESCDEPNKELPPFRITFSLIKSTVDDDYIMEIQVVYSGFQDTGSRLMQQSLKFYKEKVCPRIIKWATSNSSLGQESHPNKAPGVPSTSLKHVPVKLYYEEYKRLKERYFTKLRSSWTENTDPLKFVSEEMGIAAYIKTYVTGNSHEPSFSFVDMGCGNGVLTFALTACGASGYGFDIRARKLWDVFSQLGINTDLRVQSFNPFCDDIQRQENLWLIGNHADELTPWISVMARKINAAGFVVIPCCLFDFHGKFQRKAKNSCDAESLYQNYIHYIVEVGKKCGYSIKIDKLRIPSTKRVCIIGTALKPDNVTNSELLREAEEYVNSKVSEFPTTDESIGDIQVFKPRSPIEKVNNLTQVDRTIVNNIVQRIFSTLMSGASEEIVNHPEYLKPWNCGRTDLTLGNAADLLSRQEKDAIQNQGKGLQTLMKNHYQIFTIRNGCVLLRRPILDDLARVARRSTDKIRKVKTQTCFFNENHPDGCPLPLEICRYKH